jgi:hypothetical protein
LPKVEPPKKKPKKPKKKPAQRERQAQPERDDLDLDLDLDRDLSGLAAAWVEGDVRVPPSLVQASMAVLQVNSLGGYTERKLPCWQLSDSQSELLALATFLKLALCTEENYRHFENYHMSWGLWCFLPRDQRDALVRSWTSRCIRAKVREACEAAYTRLVCFGDEELKFASDCVVFCDSTPEFSTVRSVMCAEQSWCQAPSCAHALLVTLLRQQILGKLALGVRVNPVLGLGLGFNLDGVTFWE